MRRAGSGLMYLPFESMCRYCVARSMTLASIGTMVALTAKVSDQSGSVTYEGDHGILFAGNQ